MTTNVEKRIYSSIEELSKIALESFNSARDGFDERADYEFGPCKCFGAHFIIYQNSNKIENILEIEWKPGSREYYTKYFDKSGVFTSNLKTILELYLNTNEIEIETRWTRHP